MFELFEREMLENGSKEGSRVKHQMIFTTMLKTSLVGVSRERAQKTPRSMLTRLEASACSFKAQLT